MQKKNILFINERVPAPFFQGGAEKSIRNLLIGLNANGYGVSHYAMVGHYFWHMKHGFPNTLSDVTNVLKDKHIAYKHNKNKSSLSYINPYETVLFMRGDPTDEIKDYFKRHPKTVIITQLMYAHRIVNIAIQQKYPLIVFVRDTMSYNHRLLKNILSYNKNILILFNSNAIANFYKKRYPKIVSDVLYPSFDFNDYRITGKREPRYITMINPVRVKGGVIFNSLAKMFSEEKFLGVKCWFDPIRDKINFTDLQNVTMEEKTDDIRTILIRTKLLLIPSQWYEGFGRIAVEAVIANVPVLASRRGGLVEALGKNGWYVDKYRSPDAWRNAVLELIDMPSIQIQTRMLKIYEHIKVFEQSKIVNKLISLVEKMKI